MPFYESVFIARQDISAPQVEALAKEFADIVKNHGGQVTKIEPWGLRNLAYKIQKNRKGHYVLLSIDAPPAAVAEMERNMRIHEDVLRTLTVKVDALEAGPSAILRRDEREGGEGRGDRERGDRGDRGGRGDRGDRPARAPRRESSSVSEGAAS